MNFDKLTEEQKAEILACQTQQELQELAARFGQELTIDELEGVAGGFDLCPDYTGWCSDLTSC